MYQYQKRIGEKTMMSGWWRFSSWIMRLPNVCIRWSTPATPGHGPVGTLYVGVLVSDIVDLSLAYT